MKNNRKLVYIVTIVFVGSFLLFGYQNCGKVDFSSTDPGQLAPPTNNMGIETKLDPVDGTLENGLNENQNEGNEGENSNNIDDNSSSPGKTKPETQGPTKVCKIDEPSGQAPLLKRRVLLCHVPHGSQEKEISLLLPEVAARAHLTHHAAASELEKGDYLGLCESDKENISKGLERRIKIFLENEQQETNEITLEEMNTNCVDDNLE